MSDTLNRFIKNSITLFILNIISKISAFLLITYALRIYGVVEYGKYAFVISMVMLFYIFSDLGITTFTIKEISKNKNKTSDYFYNKLYLNIITGLLGYIILIIFFYFFKREEHIYHLFVIAGIVIILQGINSSYGALLSAYERVDLNFLIENGLNFLISLFSIILIYFKLNIIFLIICFFSGNLLKIYIYKKVTNKFIKIDFNKFTQNFKYVLKQAFPLFTILLFYKIYFYIDNFIIWFLKGNIAIGKYNPSFRFMEMTQFIPMILMTSIFPVMSKLYKEDYSKLILIYNKFLKFFILIGITITIFSILFSNYILLFIYGSQLTLDIVITFKLLMLTVIFIFIDQLLGNFLISIDKQNIITPVVIICSIFNIITNFLLIPKYGIKAAALTSMLSEIIQTFIFLIYIHKIQKINFYLYKYILKIIIIGILFIFINIYIKSLIIKLFYVIIYFILLYLFKIIDKDEYIIIKKIILKKIKK